MEASCTKMASNIDLNFKKQFFSYNSDHWGFLVVEVGSKVQSKINKNEVKMRRDPDIHFSRIWVDFGRQVGKEKGQGKTGQDKTREDKTETVTRQDKTRQDLGRQRDAEVFLRRGEGSARMLG